MFEKLFKDALSPEGREYLYKVIMAVLPLLVVYGLVEETMVPLIAGALTAVLGLGVAVGNIQCREDSETDSDFE